MKFLQLFFSFLFLQYSIQAENKSELLFPIIKNWNLTIDEIVYEPNNLWDAINGAADLYLEYNFVNLHIGTYSNADNIEVKAELYKHKTEIDAFGIYSQERDPSYNFIKIGTQGYLQRSVLNFLTGVFYIKLSSYQTSEKAQQALQKIAKEIEKHLNQANKMPHILKFFPSEGKQSNTEQYVAKNFLGYSCLNFAYTATYKNGTAFKIFIIDLETPEQASKMIAEYVNAVPNDNVSKISMDKYEIRDTHNGLIELKVVKRFICGIINCTDNRMRYRYIKELTAKLSK